MKPWYKTWWGVFILIGTWPFLLVWYTWTRSDWSKKTKIGITAASVVFLMFAAVVQSAPTTQTAQLNNIQPTPTPTAEVASATTTPTPTPTPSDRTEVKVSNVVDGDTVDVQLDGNTVRLRLIGMDTPETVDPRKPVQCYGVEASNKANELLGGKTVQLEADPSQGERDKYDRLLRYIYLPDGQNFNKLMIAEGYAFEYTFNTPYKYQAEFQQAENAARGSGKGLWASNTCDGAASPVATPTPTPPHATPTPAPTQTPVNSSSNCDPNYSGCVPNVSYDLDCSDIRFSVTVLGNDKHRFDRDGDGYGCESN